VVPVVAGVWWLVRSRRRRIEGEDK
jgi:hypothetical protein